jgi:hypothetical protein
MRSPKKKPVDEAEIDALDDDAAFVEDNDDTSSDADVCERCGCFRSSHVEGGGHCLRHVNVCRGFR